MRERGFAAAINRRDADWREQFAAATPNGVDVDFENVGGEIMEAVFARLNLHARVVLCGLIAQYGEDGRARGPENFTNLVMRRVRLEGFNVGDYLPRFRAASLRMMMWMLRGKVKDRVTLIDGLEHAPAALVGMFEGDNIGKLIVRIAAPA